MTTEQTIVCVLGMQRSGTSMTTRLLNLLGVYLGPDNHLLESHWHNPTGFWEHQGIQSINTDILECLGGTWFRPPVLEPGWERSPALERLRDRALALVDREFGDEPIWGWKHPSTSLTLPFWQSLLPRMRYVLCLRDPMGSARSLQTRDGRSLEDSVYLWLTHVRSALAHTDTSPRAAVFYEDALTDWRPVVQRLADFVGLSERAKAPEVQDAIASFIRPDLNHHRPELDETAGDIAPGVLATARAVYAELRQPENLDQGSPTALLDAACQSVQVDAGRARREEYMRWLDQRKGLIVDTSSVVPADDTLVLIDSNELGLDLLPGRRVLPFLERNGEYWGAPPDDETAIRELERLQGEGASFLAVAWPAFFWWLQSYPVFYDHVRSRFPCLVDNERVRVFDLRPA